MKKSIFILVLNLIFINVINSSESPDASAAKEFCKDQASCEDVNNACQCYCAVGKDPRDKVVGQDHPIYYPSEQDPYGKSCYCGARDLEVFKAEDEGVSHDDAVAKFKDYFPSEEETKQTKEQFAKK